MQEKIIILDFGSQTTQLIGRRVRELNMYCEIVPYNKFPHGDESVIGVILSGSPFSVYDEKAFKADLTEIRRRLPALGICYGAQFMAWTEGGSVEPAATREYGRALLTEVDSADPLMRSIEPGSQVWMSHGDTITRVPDSFKVIASTEKVRIASKERKPGASSSIPKSFTPHAAPDCCKTSSSTSAAANKTGAPSRSSTPQ